MEAYVYWSCIRFPIQLMTCESIFLLEKRRKANFGRRLALSLLGYFGAASAWYGLLHLIPGSFAAVSIAYWVGLFLLTLLPIRICYDLPVMELLFVGTSGYATEHIAFDLSKILQYVTGWYEERIGVVAEYLLFRLGIYILIAAAIYLLVVRPNRGKGEFKPHDCKVIYTAMLGLLAAIVLSVFYSDIPANRRSLLSEVLCPAYSILCCLLVIFMGYYVFRENRLQRERDTMEKLLQVANAQQKSSKEAIDIINMKCHDLKHQMRALASMHTAEERSEYLEELQQAVSVYGAAYRTGYEALDYILQEKALLASQYRIQFSCMADGTAVSFLHPADIYALMGNALDNALESVLREEEDRRIVSLNIRRRGQMVLIHLENQCSRTLEFRDGLPVTDKADRNSHGFGVQSIRYIVEKYHGELSMRTRDGIFCLDILFQSDTTL